jgi:hypothetical protein
LAVLAELDRRLYSSYVIQALDVIRVVPSGVPLRGRPEQLGAARGPRRSRRLTVVAQPGALLLRVPSESA